ncbi:LysM peptidoglycan-binding domain-containing protein [Sphingomonas sp. NIBR02145]|uniref:LysM peptidoglycan-binding domain-containing protein n=1 Tax=Sphingomonas sp. NIBR02145 TaxID=3014784 RepID=UPI0022B45938|nr:LysM peptidoglycan-binding domain-containing protein [Sphingomonas sp. NIBR02145]WHU04984.1 LysM peptidoglycan-binding domain-containing protein [Sphingomonas sp. NIBR02145]
MVAIFAGAGAGFQRGSGSTLGSSGLLGSASFGRSGEQLFLNAANGNLLISRQDEFLAGRGPDIDVSRTYNSLGNQSDDNGDNWRQSTQRVLQLNGALNGAGSTITYRSGDGSDVAYAWNGSAYVTTDGGGAYDKIVWNGSGFTRTDGSNATISETYQSDGVTSWYRLKTISDTDGNSITYGYSADKLTSISSSNGESLTYVWSGNHISEVISGDGTSTVYNYDGYGRLSQVAVQLAAGGGTFYSTWYSYVGSSTLVSRIEQSDGSILEIGYDGANRVTSMVQTAAAGDTRTTSIAYGSGYSVVTDPTNQATTLYYDGAGQLTKVVAPPASAGAAQQVVQFGYDGNGNLSTVTDAMGQTVTYGYDGWGNVTSQSDRLSNLVTRTYNGFNQVVTETRAGSDKDSSSDYHTTRFVYDGAGRLRYTISAEGNVVEYDYDGFGQVNYTQTYRTKYDVSGLSATFAPTPTDMSNWVGSVANPNEIEIVQFVYDARGNMSQRISYGAANASGSGSVAGGYTHEYFTHDTAGRLLYSVAAGQNATTYVYDGLGRLTSSTDVNGGTTSFVFNDAATTTTVTLAGGAVQTSVYNKAGDLVSFTESGNAVQGGTSTYLYDKDGRVRKMTDATGRVFYYLYDKVGRKVADISQTGEVSEYRYNDNNQLVATVHYALGSGNFSMLNDPNTTVEMAAIRPGSDPYDVWTFSVYDKEGRVIEAIEGDGSVTAYEYDASGRLVKTTAYVNKLTTGQLDAFKANGPSAWLPAASTGDSVARIFYDKAGRVIGALDGEGFLTRTIYDGAGQKVQEIAYANVTGAVYRASSSFQALINSVGTSTSDRSVRYVYDQQGNLRFTIDPLNHVTEYIYEYSSWLYSAFGPVRETIQYAATIPVLGSYTFASVKSAVAGLANDAANRLNYAIYDDAGRVAYTIDAAGGVIGFTYNALGKVTRKTEHANTWAGIGLYSKADWDNWAAGSPSSSDRITRYYYAANGDLRFTIDAEGYITRTDYDAEGRVVTLMRWATPVSPNDSWTIDTASNAQSGDYTHTSTYYDSRGQVTLVVDGAGRSTRYYYYATGLLAWEISSEGSQDDSRTLYVYDQAGHKTAAYAAYGTAEQAITTYNYDGLGNLVAVNDPNAHTTSFFYDHAGRLTRQTNAQGSPTDFAYNAFGERVSVTDALGNTSYSYYDNAGRVIATRDAENDVIETGYNAFGEIAWVKQLYNKAYNAASAATWPAYTPDSARDAVTQFEYDRLGRLTRTIDALGYYEQYTLNAFGQRTAVRNKAGGTTTNAYDRRGLLVSETLPMASVDMWGSAISATVTNTFGYDARGNRVWMREAAGLAEQRYTSFIYDKADRLIEKRGDTVLYVDQANHVGALYTNLIERYAYDTRGNLIEVVDANGARTLFYYDDLNRKIADINATGTLSTYGYDAVGNLTRSRTWGTVISQPSTAGGTPPAAPGGEYREASYTYDQVNRLRTTTVSGVRTGSWNGSVFVTTTAPLVTTNEYDAVGNLRVVTDANGGVTRYRYDALGQKTRQIDAEGYITGWIYDAQGNVVHERRWALKAIDGYYDPAVSGDDRVTNFTYDRNGRRLTEERSTVDSYGVNEYGQLYGTYGTATVSYSYNELGQVLRKTESTGDYVDYSYDASGRLIAERRGAYSEMNVYGVIRPTVRYFYNGLNNLTRTEQGVEDAGQAGRVTRYGYGMGQRLDWMIDANGATTAYYYDAAGNVVRQNYTREHSGGSTTYEGVLYTRDVLGRMTSQAVGVWDGSAFNKGDIQQTAYNAYGEVSQRGINGGWQEQFAYDGAGRLYRSNSGDGVWRYYIYDGVGNQTATIESEGSWIGANSLDGAISGATYGFAYYLGQVYVDGVNITINAYDRRNQATATILTQRQLGGSGGIVNISTARGYNAFGEALWERDVRGNQTNYTYNSMGRVTSVQRPSVIVTTEYGYSYWTNPTEYYYYDLSGRAIGVRDANGNLTTRRLLAGTGYSKGEALVAREFHADGGTVTYGYDRYGDLRSVVDEVGRQTNNYYDGMGRLTQVTRPSGQAEYYAYDVLGQRIRHWNSYYGTANVERTDYDQQGRVISQVAYGGDTTTTSYAWSWQSTNGLGSYGGWYQTTTYANGRSSVQQEDMFGHVLYTSDLGGHGTWYNYDYAGRMVQRYGGETVNYDYLNTGLISAMTSGYGSPTSAQNNFGETYQINKTSYSYDAAGNKLTESYTVENGGWYDNGWYEYNYDYGYYDQYWVSNWEYSSSVITYQNGAASYDALGRVTNWSESGNSTTPAASITYSYDANGNVRRSYATYYVLDQNGGASYQTTQDYWYRYDSMNRVVTSKGQQSGGVVRGYQGVDLAYNAAGERVQSTRTVTAYGQVYWEYYDPNMYGGWGGYNYGYQDVPYEADSREDYGYDADGHLSTVRIAQSGYYDNGDGTVTVTSPPGTGALKANYYYDGMGRLYHQIDWLGDGNTAAYDRTLTYNDKGQVYYEVTVQRQGADTITTYSSTDFGYGSNYALGAAVSISTSNYKNGSYQSYSTTSNNFAWYAGAVQASTSYTQSGQGTQTSTFYYGASGQLTSVYVADGRPHSISFTNDMNGQTIRRDEYDNVYNQGDPHEVWYRFNGKQMGYTGNNGTQNTDYQSSINQRTWTPGNGAFQNGSTYGSAYADFDQSFTGITSYNQGGAGGSYTVRTGDTLQSIAAQLWGDSSLWYQLAEANGISGAGGLVEGQALTIPSGVIRSSNSATTFTPYDPASILGDTSPTTPQPQKAAKKKSGCGVFGQVLLAVIGAVVSFIIPPIAPALGPVLSGALTAAAVNVVTQGIAVATGLQDKFSFKGVALAAIGGGVGGGLSSIGGKVGSFLKADNFISNTVRGALGNAITQGVAVVTGLQPKFDWAGVAVAGITAGVEGAVRRSLPGQKGEIYEGDDGSIKGRTHATLANSLASSAAGVLAGAATRSLLTGTDFGDNIVASLPGAIGRTLGNALAAEMFGPDDVVLIDAATRREIEGGAPQTAPTTTPPVPAGAPPAGTIGAIKDFQTILGPDVGKLLANSPSALAQIATLNAKGYKIEIGPAGKGTYTDVDHRRIVISQDRFDSAGNVVDALGHEIGHALYTGKDNLTSRADYIQGKMRGEAFATWNELTINQEINTALPNSIVVGGSTGTTIKAIFDANSAVMGKNPTTAVLDQIGAIYANNNPSTAPTKTYTQYYSDGYDAIRNSIISTNVKITANNAIIASNNKKISAYNASITGENAKITAWNKYIFPKPPVPLLTPQKLQKAQPLLRVPPM